MKLQNCFWREGQFSIPSKHSSLQVGCVVPLVDNIEAIQGNGGRLCITMCQRDADKYTHSVQWQSAFMSIQIHKVQQLRILADLYVQLCHLKALPTKVRFGQENSTLQLQIHLYMIILFHKDVSVGASAGLHMCCRAGLHKDAEDRVSGRPPADTSQGRFISVDRELLGGLIYLVVDSPIQG